MKDGAAGETLHRPACLPSQMRHRQYILELVVLLINRLFFGLILNTVICLILRKIECKLLSVLGHLPTDGHWPPEATCHGVDLSVFKAAFFGVSHLAFGRENLS